MKYIIAAILSLVIMSPVAAHEWQADKWAQDQIVLTTRVVTCSDFITESFALFKQECGSDWKTLINTFITQTSILVDAMHEHSDNTTLTGFVNADFTDKELGTAAVETRFAIGDAFENVNLKLLEFIINTQQQGDSI